MDKPAIKVKGKKNKKLKLKKEDSLVPKENPEEEVAETPQLDVAQEIDEDVGTETKKPSTVKLKIKVKKDPKKRIKQNILVEINNEKISSKEL